MIANLEPMVAQLVTRVFATMLQMKAEPVDAITEPPSTVPHVAGSIGFSGTVTGVVHFNCTDKFARKIACTMLGLADWQLDGNEMVDDVIGEITNMIAGNVASEFRNQGFVASISIPTIVRGNNFSIHNISGCKSLRRQFQCDTSLIDVEIVLKS